MKKNNEYLFITIQFSKCLLLSNTMMLIHQGPSNLGPA
jgi:hypothetical protein